MDDVVIDRGCFLGLAASAIEAYNRETNGFLVGSRGVRTVRSRHRPVTVLRAAYPLQTADRKPNWVTAGNERAFARARRAIEHLDVGYEVLGGFHSHTGDDGNAALSKTDLDYVADELRRLHRMRPSGRVRWLEVVLALRRREWSRRRPLGWSVRPYRRKIGCTVALAPDRGFAMTIGAHWVELEPDGDSHAWDVVGTREAKVFLPWSG